MSHMFMEFDLQFMIIFYILILCLDEKNYKTYEIKQSITLDTIIFIIFFIFSYYSFAYFMNYIGKNNITNNMINSTEAKISLMIDTKNLDNAKKIADEILKKNKYVYQAYNINS